MFGAAVTTSSLAVGSRCPHARAKVGAVLSQSFTDPRLGTRALDLLGQGHTAQEARTSSLRRRRSGNGVSSRSSIETAAPPRFPART